MSPGNFSVRNFDWLTRRIVEPVAMTHIAPSWESILALYQRPEVVPCFYIAFVNLPIVNIIAWSEKGLQWEVGELHSLVEDLLFDVLQAKIPLPISEVSDPSDLTV